MRPASEESSIIKMTDRVFEYIANIYEKILRTAIRYSWIVVLCVFGIAYSSYVLYEKIPQEYTPKEDTGAFLFLSRASEGTSMARMTELVKEIEAPILPYVESGEVQRLFQRVPGFGGNVNSSFGGVTLVPWSERDITPDEISAKAMAAWSQIPGLRVFPFMRSGLSRHGGGSPVQFVVGGSNYEELVDWRDRILDRVRENPGLTRVDSDLKETQPQILIHVDKNRAAELGVSVQTIGRTLTMMMSDQEITTYIVDGEEYDVVLEAMAEQKTTPDDMSNIYVRSQRTGQLIPLSNLTSIENVGGSAILNRYNRLRALTITANLADGYALGDALDYMETIAKEELPQTARIDYKGESLEYKESTGKIFFTISIAMLVVFLVLAAQFESFIHPLVIMMTVPLAIAGVLIGLYVTGYSMNIYTQIGMIMLIGIAAKNGVLIVEFINQLRDQGIEFKQAIIDAAHIRFRPVMMTTISTVMGSIPLILANGPGSESRIILGVVIFSGVSFATIFTLFVVPVFYHILAKGTGSPNAVANKLEELTTQSV
jgi:multidrug efflux pump